MSPSSLRMHSIWHGNPYRRHDRTPWHGSLKIGTVLGFYYFILFEFPLASFLILRILIKGYLNINYYYYYCNIYSRYQNSFLSIWKQENVCECVQRMSIHPSIIYKTRIPCTQPRNFLTHLTKKSMQCKVYSFTDECSKSFPSVAYKIEYLLWFIY